jgi:hypothetical protein
MLRNNLLSRDDSVCGGERDFSVCGQGCPSSWCCPNNSTCLPIYGANVTTAICCPNGNDCSVLQPIDWTVTDDPLGSIHVDGTAPTLPRCSGGFCPLGFDCINKSCSMRADARQPSSGLTPVSIRSSARRPFGLGVGVGIVVLCTVGMLVWFIWLFRLRKTLQARHIKEYQISNPTGSISRVDFVYKCQMMRQKLTDEGTE